MQSKHQIHAIVTLADDGMPQIKKITSELSEAGATVERVLEKVGVIRVLVAPHQMPDLEKIQGVLQVREESTFELSPPSKGWSGA